MTDPVHPSILRHLSGVVDPRQSARLPASGNPATGAGGNDRGRRRFRRNGDVGHETSAIPPPLPALRKQ